MAHVAVLAAAVVDTHDAELSFTVEVAAKTAEKAVKDSRPYLTTALTPIVMRVYLFT